MNEKGTYALKHKAKGEEIIFCQEIPGFTIPVNAVFDEAENMAILKKLLQ